MKYLVLGHGWIGTMLKEYLGKDAEFFEVGDIRTFTWTKFNQITEGDVVINTIAKTDIDWCEKNKLTCFEINTLAALHWAEWCKTTNRKYVFFSSGCIFESKDAFDWKGEDVMPNPQCFYAWTKAMADFLIQDINPDALILRPRLPISEKPHPRNTINKLLKYTHINDSQESVDIVEDMLPVIKKLIDKNEKGIFHLANEGTISPSEIAETFGYTHIKTTKEEQDKRLEKEGRAKRVTTYLCSNRIPPLPNIRERLPELVKKYKDYVTTGNTN